MTESSQFRKILGIRFYVGDLNGLLNLTLRGGLIVAPSAPVLAILAADQAHRAALESSDLAITDSGFMLLIWRFFKGESLRRISGLKYLRALLRVPEFRTPGATFWIMPSAYDARANCAWLRTEGLNIDPRECYIAPIYPAGPLEDSEALQKIESQSPIFIIICLGGGVQERLGHYLKQNLSGFRPDRAFVSKTKSNRPALICTGAAIAFLSGRQANIPVWADRFMLGWMFRILQSPRKFLPRYLKALRLLPLILRHGTRSVASSNRLP